LGSNPIIPARQRRHLLVAALVLLAAGLFAVAAVSARGSNDYAPAATSGAQYKRFLPVPKTGTMAASAYSRARPRKQMPIPVRLLVPAIRMNARIIPLGLNRDRTVQVPRSFGQAGWFKPGPEPGERGAAVILGHVDSKRGPGVFYRLRALRRGDVITIIVRTGSKIRFVVTGTKAVPKHRFPTKLIYRHKGGPGIRLITCDGRFDSSTGHYVDNYVVFARQILRRRRH
jgi:sortase (surface protein transpeptidase)